jgi:hypothetical protein
MQSRRRLGCLQQPLADSNTGMEQISAASVFPDL